MTLLSPLLRHTWQLGKDNRASYHPDYRRYHTCDLRKARMQDGSFLCRFHRCCCDDWNGNSGRNGRMTIPQRGIWKNSVLHNVLQEHQLKQTNVTALDRFLATPAGLLIPPNKVHGNSHIPSHLPGVKKAPPPRAPRATANSDAQTMDTRTQKRFIPGTASASAPSAVSAGRSAVKGK